MRDIIAGIVLIAIGLVMGESLFLGHTTLLAWFFDGLGIILIVMGAVKLYKSKQASAPPGP